MDSATNSFNTYEQDFKVLIDSIRSQLESDGNGIPTEQRQAASRRVEMELDEADEMAAQMEIELQIVPHSQRSQYQSRLRNAKAELLRYKNLSKELQAQFSRASLFASPTPTHSTSDEPYGPPNDRARLLAGTALLEDGTRRLQDSYRVALETEDQGADILRNLRAQREQIENSRDTLRMADTSIDRALNTLKKMVNRMYQQRVVTVAIVIILVLLIGIIVWEKTRS